LVGGSLRGTKTPRVPRLGVTGYLVRLVGRGGNHPVQSPGEETEIPPEEFPHEHILRNTTIKILKVMLQQ
jgi:hypothetical protein